MPPLDSAQKNVLETIAFVSGQKVDLILLHCVIYTLVSLHTYGAHRTHKSGMHFDFADLILYFFVDIHQKTKIF